MRLTAVPIFLLMTLLVGIHPLWADVAKLPHSQPVPIFELTFDQGLTANGQLEVTEVQTRGSVAFKPGVVGNALAVEDFSVEYRLAQPLHMLEGTVVFWFLPKRWDGVSFVDFLQAFQVEPDEPPAIRTRVYIQPHHWRGMAFLRYLPTGNINLFCNRSYVNHWLKEPTQWRQFAFTWEDGQAHLYIDGLHVTTDARFENGVDLGNRIRIGGGTYFYNEDNKRISTSGKTLVDQLRIYPTALPAEQVLQEYEQQLGPLIEQDTF